MNEIRVDGFRRAADGLGPDAAGSRTEPGRPGQAGRRGARRRRLHCGPSRPCVIKGDAKHWEPGQSNSVNGESRFLGNSKVTISGELRGAAARPLSTGIATCNIPRSRRSKYSEIRYPTYGAVIDDKGQMTPMSGIRMAANIARRRPHLAAPAAARDRTTRRASRRSRTRSSATRPCLQCSLHRGPEQVTSSCSIPRPSCRPPCARATRTTSGATATTTSILSDWKTVDGVKIAHTRSFKLCDMEVQRHDLQGQSPPTRRSRPTPSRSPTPSRPRASRRPTSNVPYQWVIRRLFLGRFTDSDTIYFASDGSFKLVELRTQRPDGPGRRRQQPDRQS